MVAHWDVKDISVSNSELKVKDSRLLVQKGIFYDGNDIAWRRDVKDAKKVKLVMIVLMMIAS